MLEADEKPRMNVDESSRDNCHSHRFKPWRKSTHARTRTHSTLLSPKSTSYIQMRENEMRWRSKDEFKPSMESVVQSALSSSSMTWSPATSAPAKHHQAAAVYTLPLPPPTSAATIIVYIPAEVALRLITLFKKRTKK